MHNFKNCIDTPHKKTPNLKILFLSSFLIIKVIYSISLAFYSMKELELKKLLENGEFTLLKNKITELSHSRQFTDQALLQEFQLELSSNIKYQQFLQNKDFSATQNIENKIVINFTNFKTRACHCTIYLQ